jgi:transcriptional regulator with XRE-family HTH domain
MPGRSVNPWMKALAGRMGARVAILRTEHGMTGRALAARCTQLGLEIKPAVLSTIETGARDSISVAEMLVLARAIGVAPMDLLAPLDAETVEFTPGCVTSPHDARAWINGDSPPRTITITVPAGASLDVQTSLPAERW